MAVPQQPVLKPATVKQSQAANLRSRSSNAKAAKESKEPSSKPITAALPVDSAQYNNCSASDSKRSDETMDADDLDAFWSLVRLLVSCHEGENKEILPKPKEKPAKKQPSKR